MSTPFQNLGLPAELDSYFKEAELVRPTPVQSRVIPEFFEGVSPLVVAQTGTGKTLAYALPAVELIRRFEIDHGVRTKKGSPLVVIMAPTRELSHQILGVLKEISHHIKFRARTLIASMRKMEEEKLAKSAFEILVATPGRLKKMVDNGKLKLDEVGMFIMDEADQLLDLGFSKEIDQVMSHLSDYTQLGLFSATFSQEIEEFTEQKLAKFEVKKVTFKEAHKLQSRVETFNLFIEEDKKLVALDQFMQKSAYGRGIIFANRKEEVDKILIDLKERMPKLKAVAIHGGKEGRERLAAQKTFAKNKAQVLVATDIAARGIDIKDLKWVLNFGLPKNPEYYLHRCGRTARAGRSGMVYNFISGRDSRWLNIINNAIAKQSALDVDTIRKELTRKKKKKTVKKKNKRVKVTKRTRFK
jgi:ATP-dependent RNA helicase RhlE